MTQTQNTYMHPSFSLLDAFVVKSCSNLQFVQKQPHSTTNSYQNSYSNQNTNSYQQPQNSNSGWGKTNQSPQNATKWGTPQNAVQFKQFGNNQFGQNNNQFGNPINRFETETLQNELNRQMQFSKALLSPNSLIQQLTVPVKTVTKTNTINTKQNQQDLIRQFMEKPVQKQEIYVQSPVKQISKFGPTNNCNELITSPSLEEMWQMHESQLQKVYNFKVICDQNYIQFLEPVNLIRVPLNNVFKIKTSQIQVDTSVYKQFNTKAVVGMKTKANETVVEQWCKQNGVQLLKVENGFMEFVVDGFE
ncbi:Nucleoporin_autopeptidase [Hexamita inflata]|uniref:Putative n=1 Tax=Hexamita inflata TaxID=28002 RepID=A0AA86NCI0_9EUKA|nr:Nucleoporin autopeptidase [Hexamita inflata]